MTPPTDPQHVPGEPCDCGPTCNWDRPFPPPDPVALTRDQTSLLLYIETCAVDHRGYLDSRHMNADDFGLLRQFLADGLVQPHPEALPSGRVPWHVIQDRRKYGTAAARHQTTRVVLTDEGWRLAHQARRARAARAAA